MKKNKLKFTLQDLQLLDAAMLEFTLHIERSHVLNKESFLDHIDKVRVKLDRKMTVKERK
jgi:hypothetical protein